MRKIAHFLAGLLLLVAVPAFAQAPQFPVTVPANTVAARLGIGPGPLQAVPFAVFNQALLAGSFITIGTTQIGMGATALTVAGLTLTNPIITCTACLTNTNLPNMAFRTVKANTTSGTATPTDVANSTFAKYLGLNLTHNEIPSYPIDVAAFRTTGYTTAGDGGDGWYVRSTSAGACPIQDASSQWWALDPAKPFNVMACGAMGDNSTDDSTAIQAALTAAADFADPGFGGPGGSVYCPPGKVFKLAASVEVHNPVTFDCQSPFNYTPSTGYAFGVGQIAGRNYPQNYIIKLRGITCSAGGSISPPNTSGNIGVRLFNMSFSLLEIGQIQNCTNAGFYCDGTGGTRAGQVIQHNTFNIGQVVNNGYGILLDSLNAATSSCEANLWNVQNTYQNYISLQVDAAGHNASTSNTFNIQSADNALSGVVIDSNSLFNVYNVGYYAGTFKLEAASTNNQLFLGNTVATGAVVSNLGGVTNRCYQSGLAPAAC